MKVFHNIAQDFRRNKVIYFLCIPIVLWYIIFCYMPMGGIVIAFQNFTPARGISGSPWVGAEHFIRFFTGPYAWRLIRNTFMLSLLDLLFNFPAPIIFALLLNEVYCKTFKKTIQTISYMPYFISLVVLCGIVVDFTKSGGVISSAVAAVTGTAPQNLLGNVKYFRTIYTVSSIWQGLGYGSIIYIAALSGIDPSLYEAATVDGASKLQRIVNIDLPGILPTIIIQLIMQCGRLMNVGHEKVLLMQNNLNMSSSDIISTYVYRIGLENARYSFSAAVGMFNSVINTFLLILVNTISRKVSETSLW